MLQQSSRSGFFRDRSVFSLLGEYLVKGRVALSREERGTSKAGKILDNKLRNTSATSLVYIVFLR